MVAHPPEHQNEATIPSVQRILPPLHQHKVIFYGCFLDRVLSAILPSDSPWTRTTWVSSPPCCSAQIERQAVIKHVRVYELMVAAGGMLASRLLPSLALGSLLGRSAPDTDGSKTGHGLRDGADFDGPSGHSGHPFGVRRLTCPLRTLIGRVRNGSIGRRLCENVNLWCRYQSMQ